jgi:parallel beta-helix repeat protein
LVCASELRFFNDNANQHTDKERIKKMERKRQMSGIVFLGSILAVSLVIHAGSLEPSAPPGPTMKTLDEVEPRIPISQADIPKTISTRGSYYLTEDVVTVDGNAIIVAVDDVTVDLAGFTLVGPDIGTNYGIYMDGRSNVEIRNGTVRDFYYGIYEASSSGQDHRVIDVRSVSNGQGGIFLLGKCHLVKNCTAGDNGDSASGEVYGIYVSSDSTVISNAAHNNGLTAASNVYGVYAGEGCTITGNTVFYNGVSADYDVYGIYSSSGSTVTGNTARNNGISTIEGSVYGINVGLGCTLTGNTACENGTLAGGTVYGIYLNGNNLVDQNTSYDNNTGNGGTNMNDPCNCTLGTNHAP